MVDELTAKLEDKTITLAEAEALTAQKDRIEALIDAFDTGVSSAETAADEAKKALDEDLGKYKELVGAMAWSDKVAVLRKRSPRSNRMLGLRWPRSGLRRFLVTTATRS